LTISEDHPISYRLKFIPEALDEWRALDGSVRTILKKLLAKRLENPVVPGSALRGELTGCFKIKLRQQGVRLVYQVIEEEVVVLVLAVGKRERDAAYRSATGRRKV
jgi:mRNA interferase RelE/StbE